MMSERTIDVHEPGDDVVLNSPALIHPTALIYGKVRLENGSSIWPYVVIRSEVHEVVVGAMTNIQDFVMLHIGINTGTIIGKNCSITHRCTLHGCTIGDNCLIGINSTIMDGCIIGDNCIVAGHTFLPEGTVIPDNSIVMGSPGKVTKTRNCAEQNYLNALVYYENACAFASQGHYRRWNDPDLLPIFSKNAAGADCVRDLLRKHGC